MRRMPTSFSAFPDSIIHSGASSVRTGSEFGLRDFHGDLGASESIASSTSCLGIDVEIRVTIPPTATSRRQLACVSGQVSELEESTGIKRARVEACWIEVLLEMAFYTPSSLLISRFLLS